MPQKIAVISSPTAAGYGDFCNQLNNNPQGYKFYIKLFAATMQGERTEQSVTAALDKIYQHEDFFDVVVIIRGGGSTSDLMCFDNYWIAYNIAQFPLPVFSGIGHERDETVVDLVAHTRLKTPTAVAEHLIALVVDFDNRLNYNRETLVDRTREILADEKAVFERAHMRLKPVVQNALLIQKNQMGQLMRQLGNSSDRFVQGRKNKLSLTAQNLHSLSHRAIRQQQNQLETVSTRLSVRLKHFFNQQQSRLELVKKTNELVNPVNILKKGYSITTLNGKVIKDASQLKQGDVITTKLSYGEVDSKVE